MIVVSVFGQKKTDFFVGEWKSYLSDNSTFEYLKLDKDGTGIKAIGKTINGKDTILSNHHSFLQITSWKLKKNELTLETKHELMYEPIFTYKLESKNSKSITILGDHFKLGIYPSFLNKDLFRSSVTFTNTKYIEGTYGLNTDTCLFELRIIDFKQLDSTFQIASYKGFDDLIPHLIGCTQEYKFINKYYDPPYELMLPADFNSWSFGCGDDNFYISLKNRNDSITESSIVIYYDFVDKNKNHYFSQIDNGKEIKNMVLYENKELYLFKNWQKKISGKIFYDNHMFVAFYTHDKSKEEVLKKCIASFRYKN